MRAWTLRDVLHAGGLPPMEDDNAKDNFFSPPPIKEPSLVCKRSIFRYQCEGKGLPVSVSRQTPLPRINCAIVVKGNTLYVYGGEL